MNRDPHESFINYCNRLTTALRNKEISYQEWADGVAGETNYGDETLRRVSSVFSSFLNKLYSEQTQNITDKDILDKIANEKRELQKERKKLQTENIIYQDALRNEARGEMFNDKILEAIECLPQFDIKPINISRHTDESIGALFIADAHYGSNIELKSLFGEVVNVYNPEIFKARLKLLAGRIVEDYDRLQYKKLIVFDVGDAIENILRVSSLTKLKVGMVDAAIQYAEIMSEWIVALRNALQIPISYKAVGGNHDLARLLSSKKDFPEENLMKVIVELIKLRLKDCTGIEISDYNECQFETLYGENILVYHGDDAKSEQEEMAFWENYHDIPIDILILAHKHSKNEQGVGYGAYGDKEVIHIPSLVGIDPYAKKVRKMSKAGAKFILFETGYGKTLERTYYLN